MKKALALGIFALLWTTAAPARSIVWMDLSADIAYKDASTACSAKGSFLNQIYLAAEVADGKFVQAKMKQGSMLMPFREIEFLPEELAGVSTQNDPSGRPWLKNFPLSARLAGWLFFQLGSHECGIPQTIQTIEKAPLAFAFATSGLGVEGLINISNAIDFTGTRKDGQPFAATMRLYQRPNDVPDGVEE